MVATHAKATAREAALTTVRATDDCLSGAVAGIPVGYASGPGGLKIDLERNGDSDVAIDAVSQTEPIIPREEH